MAIEGTFPHSSSSSSHKPPVSMTNIYHPGEAIKPSGGALIVIELFGIFLTVISASIYLCVEL